MALYRRLVRPLFFRLDPESAHGVAMGALKVAARLPLGLRTLQGLFDYADRCLETNVLGMSFRNPVGLAAGYDRNGTAVRELVALGFGHLEVGTVTLLPQIGNPRPRIVRLPKDEAVINRVGFANEGADRTLARLAQVRRRPLAARVGVNIGKGTATPLELALDDYRQLLARAHRCADFVVVNVSSPNTPGLRSLQTRGALGELLGELARQRAVACSDTPLLVKIAPDLTPAEIDDVLDVGLASGISGVVATNTTLSRAGLNGRQPDRYGAGGLSGAPLRSMANEVIRYIYRQTGGSLPIIGVGGVDSPAAALEKIRAGASLVQVYTGLIYQGPGLVWAINRGLAAEVRAVGASSVSDLVGSRSGPTLRPIPALPRTGLLEKLGTPAGSG